MRLKQKLLSLWSKGYQPQHSSQERAGVELSAPGTSFMTLRDAAQFHCESNDGLPACSKLGSKALERDSHRNQGKMSCFPPGSKEKLTHVFYILTSAVRNTKKVELWHPAVQVHQLGQPALS